MPILLGVSGKDKFTLESQLRYAQRELRLNAKLLQQARDDNSEERAIGLLSEARAVEIPLGDSDVPPTVLLRRALDWKPTSVPGDDGSRVSSIENELLDLRERSRKFNAASMVLNNSPSARQVFSTRSTSSVNA